MAAQMAKRRAARVLESSVLATSWAAEESQTAGQVQKHLPVELVRTTATTILLHLFRKGAVNRQQSGRGFAYFPIYDARGLAARHMHHELDKVSGHEPALVRFAPAWAADGERALRELLDDGGG